MTRGTTRGSTGILEVFTVFVIVVLNFHLYLCVCFVFGQKRKFDFSILHVKHLNC